VVPRFLRQRQYQNIQQGLKNRRVLDCPAYLREERKISDDLKHQRIQEGPKDYKRPGDQGDLKRQGPGGQEDQRRQKVYF
jgi:hypothetical protein